MELEKKSEVDENDQLLSPPGKVQQAEIEILWIEKQYKAMQQHKINNGLPKLDEMPPDLQQRHDEALAVLDVLQEEADKIKEKIKYFESKEEEKRAVEMLKHGPLFTRQGDPPVAVDGQAVGLVEDEPTIVDKKSPYNGMKLKDYYQHVHLPFVKERKAKGRSIGRGTIPKSQLPGWPSNVKAVSK